jgi:hypothetical protein
VTGILDVLGLVITAFERARVRYTIGGSFASSFAGEPRASLDADIVVEMDRDHVAPFVEALGTAFYLDEEALRRAVMAGSSTNVIHHASGVKVDLFVASSALDRQQLERRRPVTVDGNRTWYVHSPEDILLQKLLWYRRGNESSDRQWRDILGIVLVRGDSLDRAYVDDTAATLQLTDLLERARREVQGR